MKQLFLFVSLFLFSGCTIESLETEINNKTPDENNYSYGVGGNVVTNNCPPPYNIIVIINGKPTEQKIISPCYLSNINEIVSDKGWGTSEDHSFWLPESLPDIQNPPPGDPLP